VKLLLWKLSAISLSFSAGADMASSMRPGIMEANPLLAQHGQFTGRSVAISSVITGAVLGGEWLFLRKHPKWERPLEVGNFVASGVHLGATIHNERLK
jgi:hypothetical protein